MKKIAFTAILISIAFFACTKTNSNPNQSSNYSITAVVNGQNVSFNYGVTVDTSQQGEMAIQGYIDSTAASPYIFMNLQFTYPLTIGTYGFNTLNGTGDLSYIGDHAGTPQVYTSSNDSIMVATITKTAISGTFFGTTLYYAEDYNNGSYYLDSTKIITNGKFTIKPGQQ